MIYHGILHNLHLGSRCHGGEHLSVLHGSPLETAAPASTRGDLERGKVQPGRGALIPSDGPGGGGIDVPPEPPPNHRHGRRAAAAPKHDQKGEPASPDPMQD